MTKKLIKYFPGIGAYIHHEPHNVKSAYKIEKPTRLYEGRTFKNGIDRFEFTLIRHRPKYANAYDLLHQKGRFRLVQYYRISLPKPRPKEKVSLEHMISWIAYHPECENNCIPSIPK